jgi:hypothetical protein
MIIVAKLIQETKPQCFNGRFPCRIESLARQYYRKLGKDVHSISEN